MPTVSVTREVNGWASAALDDMGLDVYEFRAYMTIARRAGSDGACWEAVGSMAARCGMSERRMQAALRSLEARGLVAREQRVGGTSIYRRLLLQVAADPAPQDTLGGAPHAGGGAPRAGGGAPDAPKGLPPKDYPVIQDPTAMSDTPEDAVQDAPSGGSIMRTAQRQQRTRQQPRHTPQQFLDVWNEHRGNLPAARTLTGERLRGVVRLQKALGDEALDVWRDAVRAVARDDWWLTHGYTMTNLLRSDHAVAKAEAQRHEDTAAERAEAARVQRARARAREEATIFGSAPQQPERWPS